MNLPLADIASRDVGCVAGEKCGTEEADRIVQDHDDDGDAMATDAIEGFKVRAPTAAKTNVSLGKSYVGESSHATSCFDFQGQHSCQQRLGHHGRYHGSVQHSAESS